MCNSPWSVKSERTGVIGDRLDIIIFHYLPSKIDFHISFIHSKTSGFEQLRYYAWQPSSTETCSLSAGWEVFVLSLLCMFCMCCSRDHKNIILSLHVAKCQQCLSFISHNSEVSIDQKLTRWTDWQDERRQKWKRVSPVPAVFWVYDPITVSELCSALSCRQSAWWWVNVFMHSQWKKTSNKFYKTYTVIKRLKKTRMRYKIYPATVSYCQIYWWWWSW